MAYLSPTDTKLKHVPTVLGHTEKWVMDYKICKITHDSLCYITLIELKTERKHLRKYKILYTVIYLDFA